MWGVILFLGLQIISQNSFPVPERKEPKAEENFKDPFSNDAPTIQPTEPEAPSAPPLNSAPENPAAAGQENNLNTEPDPFQSTPIENPEQLQPRAATPEEALSPEGVAAP